MGFLYINSKGQKWCKHSYSAGLLFNKNPYFYYLQKVLGWRVKDNLARFAFGRALEEAIEFYHSNFGKGGVEAFERNWDAYKDTPLIYTRTEKDWASLLRTGREMMRLYIIHQPRLPIPIGAHVVFQREYSKEVFPGLEPYSGIEHAGKLDIIAYVDPNHPLLPSLPTWGFNLRPVIIDIKTSAVDFSVMPGLAAFDIQLRGYSWLSGIRTVALLWFVKKSHSLQKGSSITLLEAHGNMKAGQEGVIAMIDGDYAYLVSNDFLLEEMHRAQGEKNGKTEQTKEAKARKLKWLEEYAVRVPGGCITKQRLQFNIGIVSEESALDAGRQVGDQIVRIVNAWTTNTYPQLSGIRYPKDDSQDPYFRAFVLQDEVYKKENFVKRDDEINDMFEDTGEGVNEDNLQV